MKYWTREEWLKTGTAAQRQLTAVSNPLAWILEYEPVILLPGKGLVAFEPWEFQQEFLACRDRYRAINKPRQCGISTTAAAEAAWEFDNLPGAQIVIISKDRDAAINFHKYVYRFLESVRKKNKNAPRLLKTNERETTNANGSRIVSLAAGKEAGRSFSATHLYFDELAFAQYAYDIWQAASATLAQTKGRVTAISTPKGKANLFFEIFDSPPQIIAGKKTGLNEMGFKTFSYGWWDVPTYNPYYAEYKSAKSEKERQEWIQKAREYPGGWYQLERPKYTDLAWRQEFEGAFDANKGTVFATRSLERTFRRNYLNQINDPDRLISEWWSINPDGKPSEGRIYATGIDLGRKGDATVLVTFDVTDMDLSDRDLYGRVKLESRAKLVDYKWVEPGTLEWSELGRIARRHLETWEPDSLHDASGTGDSFSESVDGYSEPFVFTKESKNNTVTTMQHAYDFGAITMPKIKRLFREHQKYEWDDDDIVQDTVMATGLAIRQFYDGGADIMLGFEKVEFMESLQPA